MKNFVPDFLKFDFSEKIKIPQILKKTAIYFSILISFCLLNFNFAAAENCDCTHLENEILLARAGFLPEIDGQQTNADIGAVFGFQKLWNSGKIGCTRINPKNLKLETDGILGPKTKKAVQLICHFGQIWGREDYYKRGSFYNSERKKFGCEKK